MLFIETLTGILIKDSLNPLFTQAGVSFTQLLSSVKLIKDVMESHDHQNPQGSHQQSDARVQIYVAHYIHPDDTHSDESLLGTHKRDRDGERF